MKINNQYRLVIRLAVAQLLCSTLGLTLFATWLSGSIRDTVHQQILADNIQTARQMTVLISEMRLGDVRTDPQDWARMQKVVREIRLPNDGYVCLVDINDGGLICHPMLKSQPKRRPATFQVSPVEAAVAGRVSGGIVGSGEGLEVVAAAEIPSMQARVMVHQRGPGIDRAVANITGPIVPIGSAIAVGLVATTSLALLAVIRGYDNQLARANEQLEERVEQRTRSLRKTRDAVIFGLAKLAESRDTDTGEHLERIRTYVDLLSRQLHEDGIHLDPQTLNEIGLASSLHDIGKVGVADRVLLKPGRLDYDERTEMEKHAAMGGDCLAAIGDRLGDDDFLQLAKQIAYGHHEKWDGSGYPAGSCGEAIPLSARIVAVADVYDALRSRRPYKEPMSHDKARAILLESRGSHFDPIVVEAFLACEKRFVEISERSNAASARDHAGTEEADAEPMLA